MASRAKRKWKHRQIGIRPELKRKLVSTGLWKGQRLVSPAFGEQKMSSILLDFVAPYTAIAESEDEFRSAIQMGLIAWNLALIPEDVRAGEVESLIEHAVPAGGADV